MKKEIIEKLFMQEQFDDLLDILFENKILNKEQFDYYNTLYYNEKDYKEDFIKNILESGREK